MKLATDSSQIVKHGIAIGAFILVFTILFHPAIFGGKSLARHDIQQWRASAKAIEDYRDRTGEEPLWTNSMFSGMPATLVSTLYSGDVLEPIIKVLNFYRPYSLILISCLCFYVLMLTFNVNQLIASIGAISYSCSSYVLIGLAAGHSSRIAAIAFLPLVVAGVHLIFQNKLRWGFIITALGLALEIKVNHLQITYYLALILLVYGIHHVIIKVKEKDSSLWTRQVPVLVLAVILAVGANFGRIWNIADYGKYSTRGKSELVNDSGLEREYIFEFSNGIMEPMVLFIPNFFGGSSREELSPKSNLAQAMRDNGVPRNQINQYIQAAPTYWGQQRLTAPYYAGAIAVFLAVLGILTLEKRKKIWLLITLALGIMLSWGDNFSALNYFLFENLPGYNKFRSVTFTILLAIFGIAALASLGLDKVLKEGKSMQKQLLYALVITGGFALLAAIFAGAGRYSAPVDETLLAQQTPQWFVDALREDRASLLRKDALRSAFYVILAGMLVYLMIKERISKKLGLITLLAFSMLDVVLVDKRYLNASSFTNEQTTEVTQTQADSYILNNANSGERVLNLLNPFNDALTSYFHESIGGYHGAKLGRYQELIEYHLNPEIQEFIARIQGGDQSTDDLGVLNMLNTRFLKFGNAPQQVIENTNANGNAWFVEELIQVNSATEEINTLGEIDTKRAAVIDVSKFQSIQNFVPAQTQWKVQLISRDMNAQSYSYSSDGEGLIVFSEIYYPKGWIATIDGVEAELLRANYVLRALKVPAGEHTITLKYEPEIYAKGNTIMLISGILLLLACLGAGVYPLVQKKKKVAKT
ncbi:MAG: YfhO family protein [Ekhidna sp.]